jgi:hypothetical protein
MYYIDTDSTAITVEMEIRNGLDSVISLVHFRHGGVELVHNQSAHTNHNSAKVQSYIY